MRTNQIYYSSFTLTNMPYILQAPSKATYIFYCLGLNGYLLINNTSPKELDLAPYSPYFKQSQVSNYILTFNSKIEPYDTISQNLDPSNTLEA